MPDSAQRPGDTAVLTAEPPATPPAPPASGTETPDGRGPNRRWIGWVVGVLVVVLVVAGLVALVAWSLGRSGARSSGQAAAQATAFASAMKKAGVKATYPPTPVALDSLKATGSHPFDATFTPEEISALMNAYTLTVPVQGNHVALSKVTVGFPAPGTATLAGTVAVSTSSYSGSVTGPLVFSNGVLSSTGATDVQAEGFAVSGAQAQQVTAVLLGYLNGYLAAAPGLKIDSATITADGAHVTGTAPDAIAAP